MPKFDECGDSIFAGTIRFDVWKRINPYLVGATFRIVSDGKKMWIDEKVRGKVEEGNRIVGYFNVTDQALVS